MLHRRDRRVRREKLSS